MYCKLCNGSANAYGNKTEGLKTYFLPFNKGNGEGIETGKGNPLNPDGFGVSYVWEDILQKII